MSILTHCQNLDYAYIKGEGDVKKTQSVLWHIVLV